MSSKRKHAAPLSSQSSLRDLIGADDVDINEGIPDSLNADIDVVEGLGDHEAPPTSKTTSGKKESNASGRKTKKSKTDGDDSHDASSQMHRTRPFTEEETAYICKLVDEHGTKWSVVGPEFNKAFGRTNSQIWFVSFA
ncbi:hypothetical protein HDV00_012642 [Rhizophlyctis rosea]|nr:hypothetical protein HDV00_012642 [Rhizophlyctis rosea]